MKYPKFIGLLICLMISLVSYLRYSTLMYSRISGSLFTSVSVITVFGFLTSFAEKFSDILVDSNSFFTSEEFSVPKKNLLASLSTFDIFEGRQGLSPPPD